jgi:uncharacterized protein YceH (UPF0502 family)
MDQVGERVSETTLAARVSELEAELAEVRARLNALEAKFDEA